MLASPRITLRLLVTIATLLIGSTLAGASAAQIKNPGDHIDYAVELEPHFVLQWDNTYYADDGIGLGGRVNFPIIKNGPVRTINNNFAIGVGLDWVHFSGCYGYGFNGVVFDDCSHNQIHVPVVAQWNFFFTPVVSAFAELGLGIRHATFDLPCGGPARVIGPYCNGSDTDVEGIFAVGPRFHVADAFAITLRIGYPYLSAGVSFFL
jgi:hypothetical protein